MDKRRTQKKLCILVVEGEPRDAALIEHALKEGGFDFSFRRVDNETEFLRELDHFPPSVILSEHALPSFDGFTALSLTQQKVPDVPFIFVTGLLGEEMTVHALKSGATDFVLKHRLNNLPAAVHRALRRAEFRRQRQQAEEALLSSEEQYRSLVELSPDALLVQLDEKIAFINSAGMKLFGASGPEHLIGRSLGDLVSPDDRRNVMKRLTSMIDSGKPTPFLEQLVVRLDGTPVYIELAAAPVILAGKSAAQVIGRDISERKRAEEDLRRLNVDLERRVIDRTAELEAVNNELEAFSYSVAHDLRGPLRHVDGIAEILIAGKSDLLDTEIRQHLLTIGDAARKMGRLLDDLLSFSRAARAELNKTSVDLVDLVRGVIDAQRHEIGARDVVWEIGKLPTVWGDPALLGQVLLNLISNAVKFTRKRKTARIEITCRDTENAHLISVRDNGVGFDMSYTQKLFGVFQRLHRAADFEGTGVGLANVRRIINRHGGSTWAEGAVDTGATFSFLLPHKPNTI